MTNNLHETNIAEVTARLYRLLNLAMRCMEKVFIILFRGSRLSETVDVLPITISERLIVNWI